jgi:hypothetical protein
MWMPLYDSRKEIIKTIFECRTAVDNELNSGPLPRPLGFGKWLRVAMHKTS